MPSRCADASGGDPTDLGTPEELREQAWVLGEWRCGPSNLAVAEELLSPLAESDGRFSTYNALATGWICWRRMPDAARVIVEGSLQSAGLQMQDILLDDPTLENTFVARLRALGEEMHDEPFPGAP